jgi:hypothetical protein
MPHATSSRLSAAERALERMQLMLKSDGALSTDGLTDERSSVELYLLL